MISYIYCDYYLVYQPEFWHGKVISYEALLRKKSCEDLFPYHDFQQLSQEQQQELTEYIAHHIYEVIQDVEQQISFNVSPAFLDQGMTYYIAELSKNLPPHTFVIEIIEDSFLQSPQEQYLRYLYQEGVGIRIDDVTDQYGWDNLRFIESIGIPFQIKVNMGNVSQDLLPYLREYGPVIQEGDKADITSTEDIIQSFQLSKPVFYPNKKTSSF